MFQSEKINAYQKNKNALQALLPLIGQMCEGVAYGKYSIDVFADLLGAFDAVWRKGALYKLHKAGITNNLLSVFSSFLTGRSYRNLVNSYTSDWASTNTGVPQGLGSQKLFQGLVSHELTAYLFLTYFTLNELWSYYQKHVNQIILTHTTN